MMRTAALLVVALLSMDAVSGASIRGHREAPPAVSDPPPPTPEDLPDMDGCLAATKPWTTYCSTVCKGCLYRQKCDTYEGCDNCKGKVEECLKGFNGQGDYVE